jgi:hypothetical protein
VPLPKGCHAQLVSTNIKTAPRSGGALARVVKKQNTLGIFAPANAAEIACREQIRERPGHRDHLICGGAKIPASFESELLSVTLQPYRKPASVQQTIGRRNGLCVDPPGRNQAFQPSAQVFAVLVGGSQ